MSREIKREAPPVPPISNLQSTEETPNGDTKLKSVQRLNRAEPLVTRSEIETQIGPSR
jgi:hypothetical protein